MTINSALVGELFRGFYIQRWNDRIRPMDLIEMDKHAHKMIIAWCIAKYEESKGRDINWNVIIKYGIFELLRRIVISDVKSPIYARLTSDPVVFEKLNRYIFRQLENMLTDETFRNEFEMYLFEPDTASINARIMNAAHIYASYWEFQIIRESNPTSYQNIRIETELLNSINLYKSLEGINKLTNRHTISNFIDLFGQLRFQIRWAQTPRIPRTSVLGHSLLVACISYLLALENRACRKRLYNAFFGGLFHDLPEAVTRDIISPLKRTSKDFEKLLKDIEQELAETEIYPLIESEWIDEIKYFTRDEFANKIKTDSNIIKTGITTETLNEQHNNDSFNPYDGEIIRAADHLSAYLEAWNSINAGIKSKDLEDAAAGIKNDYGTKKVGKFDMKIIYDDFGL